MANFCTQCGTPADADARFCDHCGKPSLPATVPAVAVRPGKRAVVIGGGVAVVLALAGAAAFLFADEAASPEVLSKAIGRYYQQNPEAASRLLCAGGLQLDADPVVVNSFESQRRGLMDALVAAGLFAAPEVQTSGSFFTMQTYRYGRTEAGKHAVQNGRLCVAQGLDIQQVHYDQRQQGKKLAVLYSYAYKQPQAWLQGDLAAQISRRLDPSQERLAVLELREGKWVMTSDDPLQAKAVAIGGVTAAPQVSMLQRVQGWFRFGNPLLGNWRIANAPWLAGAVVRFDAETAAVGRPSEPVTYEVKGDVVTVRYVQRNHSEVFYVRDADHISLTKNNDAILLERIKD
jgi:hypothetical protein